MDIKSMVAWKNYMVKFTTKLTLRSSVIAIFIVSMTLPRTSCTSPSFIMARINLVVEVIITSTIIVSSYVSMSSLCGNISRKILVFPSTKFWKHSLCSWVSNVDWMNGDVIFMGCKRGNYGVIICSKSSKKFQDWVSFYYRFSNCRKIVDSSPLLSCHLILAQTGVINKIYKT